MNHPGCSINAQNKALEHLFRPFEDILVNEEDIDEAETGLTSEVGNWFDKAQNAVEDFGEKTSDTISKYSSPVTDKIGEYTQKAGDKMKETYNNWRRLETQSTTSFEVNSSGGDVVTIGANSGVATKKIWVMKIAAVLSFVLVC